MRRFLIAAAACLLAAPALAEPGSLQNPSFVRPGPISPYGYCQATPTGTAAKLSALCSNGVPNGVAYALICNEGTAVRWRDDGVAPTSSIGQILGTGTATAPICAGFQTNFSALQFIGSSTLDVSFYQ